MNNFPLVTFCIPAYNVSQYIEATINSLLSQSYKNIELIIVDDSSTDNTWLYLQEIKDKRVNIFHQHSKGAAAARNEAFRWSGGEYIIFFDADDLVEQDYLYNQLQTLNGKTDSVSLAQWGRFVNNDLTTFELIPNPKHTMNLQTWVEEFWYNVNPMTNPGRVLIPRHIIDKAGLWNEELSLNDDLEFFTRIFDNSASIIFNNQSTFYYRSGVNGLSCYKGKEAYASFYKSVKLSTEIVLKNYNKNIINKACANMWTSFIYVIYPNEKHLVKLAEKELKDLVKSDLEYPAGGITKLLNKIIGWKLTFKLKTKLYKCRKTMFTYISS